MKSHVKSALRTFEKGCDRSDTLRHLYSYIGRSSPAALDCSDMLRSAIVLAVSSFDLLVHDLYRLEVAYRLTTLRPVPSLRVPFDAVLSSGAERATLVDESIRLENSFKSFVAPDKLADCLRPLVGSIWERVAVIRGRSIAEDKASLKAAVDLRNRIAHEADVNPALGGIDLWPIYNADVEDLVGFLRAFGAAVASVVADS